MVALRRRFLPPHVDSYQDIILTCFGASNPKEESVADWLRRYKLGSSVGLVESIIKNDRRSSGLSSGTGTSEDGREAPVTVSDFVSLYTRKPNTLTSDTLVLDNNELRKYEFALKELTTSVRAHVISLADSINTCSSFMYVSSVVPQARYDSLSLSEDAMSFYSRCLSIEPVGFPFASSFIESIFTIVEKVTSLSVEGIRSIDDLHTKLMADKFCINDDDPFNHVHDFYSLMTPSGIDIEEDGSQCWNQRVWSYLSFCLLNGIRKYVSSGDGGEGGVGSKRENTPAICDNIMDILEVLGNTASIVDHIESLESDDPTDAAAKLAAVLYVQWSSSILKRVIESLLHITHTNQVNLTKSLRNYSLPHILTSAICMYDGSVVCIF